MQNANNAYELTFILGEKAHQEAATAKVAQITKFIEEQGGAVEKTEFWGRRELAYIIDRNRTGFYTTVWFTLPAASVKPFNEFLRFEEDIIRSLVTKAYTTAQPGSLYPVVEEEKPARAGRGDKASAEEMLRRSTTKKEDEIEVDVDLEEVLPEEERLKQLDETLDELLKDEA